MWIPVVPCSDLLVTLSGLLSLPNLTTVPIHLLNQLCTDESLSWGRLLGGPKLRHKATSSSLVFAKLGLYLLLLKVVMSPSFSHLIYYRVLCCHRADYNRIKHHCDSDSLVEQLKKCEGWEDINQKDLVTEKMLG